MVDQEQRKRTMEKRKEYPIERRRAFIRQSCVECVVRPQKAEPKWRHSHWKIIANEKVRRYWHPFKGWQVKKTVLKKDLKQLRQKLRMLPDRSLQAVPMLNVSFDARR